MKKLILIFLVIFAFNYSFSAKKTNKSDLQNRIKTIDKEVKNRKTRVNVIDKEKKSIANQITDIERDINVIEKDRQEILSEIEVVSKNIDYGERSLKMTSSELTRKKSEYSAKINAWDKYIKNRGNNPDDSEVRKNFRGLLYGDLGRIEHIQTVQFDITKVKKEIEGEKKKLSALQVKLDQNKYSMDKKVIEKNALIARLNQEKQGHTKAISKLEQEKKRIQRELARLVSQVVTKRVPKDTTVTTVPAAIKKIGGLSRPVAGNIVVSFGERKGGVVASNGVEIASHMGAKIKAAANGTVVYANKFQGLVNVVMIDYGSNLIGVYGNLISYEVSVGQKVSRGQSIGTLGKSSEGQANLYYEVRFNKQLVNPAACFR